MRNIISIIAFLCVFTNVNAQNYGHRISIQAGGGTNNVSQLMLGYTKLFGYSEDYFRMTSDIGTCRNFNNANWVRYYATVGINFDTDRVFGRIKVGNIYDASIGLRLGRIATSVGIYNYRGLKEPTNYDYYVRITTLLSAYENRPRSCMDDSWGNQISLALTANLNQITKQQGYTLAINFAFGD